MTTVREIAKFAGVSKSTVSLVLNNKEGVSEEMRELVLRAMHELQSISGDDYHPEAPADKPRPLSIMVLHPPVLRSSHVFSSVLQGIQVGSEAFNAQLRLVANEPEVNEGHVAHLYLTDDNLRPDGIIIFGARQQEPLIERAVALGIPCVVLGRDATKYAVSGIGRDEVAYAKALTRHLIALGHERIAFLGGEIHYDYTHTRFKGYRQALEEANLPYDDAYVKLGDGAHATEQALSAMPRVTALIYVNDSYAQEGLAYLHARRVRIPQELSVASFDDTDFARTHTPPLTSVAYNRLKEGQWAVKILVDQIRNPFIERTQMMFKASVIVRASTAPPNLRD
jgi:DNA-binding LacI/PurR family transcriptional regulator